MMQVRINVVALMHPRFERLPGLPPFGPLARTFGGPQHSEGLVVRFWKATGEAWIGNFHGSHGRAEGVLDHPDKRRVVVLARGQGYVVDPDTPEDVSTFGYDFHEFFLLHEFGAILFVDDLGMEAINEGGFWWRTPRIAWDEIRRVRIEGDTLYGEASTPIGSPTWMPFTVDLRTGECKDGIYEADMRRAIPAVVRR
jgi:hypothetical protein